MPAVSRPPKVLGSYGPRPVGKPLMKSSRLKQETADANAESRAWWTLCRYVSRRDAMACRCCERKVIATLARVPNRAEHHHLIPRSLGGPDTKENVCLLCAWCHDERHVTRELSVTGNAERRVQFSKAGRVWYSSVTRSER